MKIEYRTPSGGAGTYTTLADDSTTTGTVSRISAYKPSLHATPIKVPLALSLGQAFASFIRGAEGSYTLSFIVDRQHASADAALLFLQQHPAVFAIAGQFDLKITVGAQVVYLPACAIEMIDPDEHSDQHTLIRYSFVGGSYTTTAP